MQMQIEGSPKLQAPWARNLKGPKHCIQNPSCGQNKLHVGCASTSPVHSSAEIASEHGIAASNARMNLARSTLLIVLNGRQFSRPMMRRCLQFPHRPNRALLLQMCHPLPLIQWLESLSMLTMIMRMNPHQIPNDHESLESKLLKRTKKKKEQRLV